MSGIIAVTAAETGRYSLFSADLARLCHWTGMEPYFVTGSDREIGRNVLVEQMLGHGDMEWLLFLDDDQAFAPDLLQKLLGRGKSIVGGLYMRRDMPFSPIAYSELLPDGTYLPLDLREHPEGGLVQVAAVGTGGMLIRRQVLETIPPPWFQRGPQSEDLMFCEAAKAEGFKIYCDLDAKLGHLTVAAVWPALTEHGWHVGFDIAGFNILNPVS
jgi:hypothetical protein